MVLQEVFPLECIKVDLEAEDKDEAFEELVDVFCQSPAMSGTPIKAGITNVRDELLAAIKTREAKMSTGIHNGIGVPHGSTDAVDSVCGVVGISRKGIDYDALDGEPVYLLFMIFAPNEDKETPLKILKRIAELLEDSQFYNDLRAQKDAQSVYRVIGNYDNMQDALS